MKVTRSILAMAIAGALLTGCNLLDDDDDSTQSTGTAAELRILHMNDHHSHLTSDSYDLNLAGTETEVEAGGFPMLVTKFQELADSATGDVLKLHAGDAITGDLYYTLFKGEADAAMMNQICFDAFALGNHEFDDGDAGLVTFLDYLNNNDTGCVTPALAANVVPEVGVSPLAMNTATDYIQPYTVKEIDGQKYGIIGIDIANKTANSSNPDATTEFLDEVETAQKYIDELTADGVNKIILLTHYQFQNDRNLAQALTGVDVIVGGDSHTLLGDAYTDLGLTASGSYPTVESNLDGNDVCIVHAWEYAAIVGELNVSFDADGVVTACSGTAHLPLADNFVRDDVQLTDADYLEVVADIDNIAELSIVTPDADTASLLEGYSEQVAVLQQAEIGTASENLCFERIPGQGRSAICDVADTSANGSDISNIVAKAFLEISNTSDISIQNGGGVRTDIAAGSISVGDAYTLLPFANTLLELEMTGQEIIDVLEEAIEYALDPEGSTGAYPYASGLRWDLDMNAASDARFTNVEVNSRVAGEWTPIDTTATYKVVTNDYTGGGRDGYITFGEIADDKRVDTFLDYALSFVQYVEAETAAGNTIDKLPLDEYSTQNFTALVE
ncbi:NAD nucleotidase [Leucothrix sargassi]|nr:NAD nucleotidase [Leucothrix sargassi]